MSRTLERAQLSPSVDYTISDDHTSARGGAKKLRLCALVTTSTGLREVRSTMTFQRVQGTGALPQGNAVALATAATGLTESRSTTTIQTIGNVYSGDYVRAEAFDRQVGANPTGREGNVPWMLIRPRILCLKKSEGHVLRMISTLMNSLHGLNKN